MYRTIFLAALTTPFYLLPQVCEAADEYLSFEQVASGHAVANIQGDFVFCDVNGGFVGNPEISIAFEIIEITSTILWGDCNPGRPPYPPPVPYQLTQDLGTLADGQYTVTWKYTTVAPVATLLTLERTLWVESGEIAIFHGSFE